MNINEQAAADAIMSARHSDAFDREACVKILREFAEKILLPLSCAAQPKPESWQEMAITDVLRERKNQQQKWGEQNHEMPIWLAILHEESGELSEAVLHSIFGGPKRNEVFKEAVHVAAVGLQIVEFLRRGNKPNIERSHASQPQQDTPEEIQALHDAAARLAGAQSQRSLGFGTSQFDRSDTSPQLSKASPSQHIHHPNCKSQFNPPLECNCIPEASPLGERSEPRMATAICPFCHGSFVVEASHIMELQQRSDQPSGSGRTTDDKQEWTVGSNMDSNVYCGAVIIGVAYNHSQAIEFADAHNAKLAAERQAHKETQERANTHAEQCGKAQQELAVERQRREQAERGGHKIRILTEPSHLEGLAVCDRCNGGEVELETPCAERMEQQLLSALAVIDEARKYITNNPEAAHRVLININLSALRKHDAEVRKPLVDALELIANARPYDSAICPSLIAKDALAKVNP